MSSRHSFMFESFTLSITPEYFLFHAKPRAPMTAGTRERLGPPRFRRGRRANHFTWPRHPSRKRHLRGKYDLHLTYEPRDHHTVLALDPRDLERPAEAWMRRIVVDVATSFRLVSLEELQQAGWFASLPTASITATLDRFAQQLPKKFRLKPDHLRGLTESIELVAPVGLATNITARAPIQLLRAPDDAAPIETAWLKYMPQGMFDLPAGWYLLPNQDDIPQRFIELAPRELVEPFIELFLVVARELEAEVKVEELNLLRQRLRD